MTRERFHPQDPLEWYIGKKIWDMCEILEECNESDRQAIKDGLGSLISRAGVIFFLIGVGVALIVVVLGGFL